MLYTPVSPSVPEVQGVYANGGGWGGRGVYGGVCVVFCRVHLFSLGRKRGWGAWGGWGVYGGVCVVFCRVVFICFHWDENAGGVRGVGGGCMVECALYFVVLCSFVFTCCSYEQWGTG